MATGTDDFGRRVVRHGGSWSGARSELRVFRDDGLVVAVLSNRRGTDTVEDGDRINHNPGVLANSIADAVLYAPPELTVADDVVTVDEGQVAHNSGTVSPSSGATIQAVSASVGTVTRSAAQGTWDWSWQTADGPADAQTVTISASDFRGGQTEITFELEVDNVAPTVTIDPAQVDVSDEGDTVTLEAAFTDPGWKDEHAIEIDWGVPDDHPGEVVDGPESSITDPGGPTWVNGTQVTELKRVAVSGTYRYGDNDDGQGFEVEVTVTDDDGGVGTATVTMTVDNVDPTVTVDHTHDTVVLDGTPTILAAAGDELDFDVKVTDPGSDDLEVGADFGDGTTKAWTSLVNHPDGDPPISPTVQRRDETFPASHTFTDACAYQVTFSATDDDNGTGSATIDVIITGTAERVRGPGYWFNQYRERGPAAYTPDTLTCFLDIAGQLSEVFHDEVEASTLETAADVLHPHQAHGQMTVQLDRQLLTAWVNVASGAIGYDDLVDATGDGEVDTAFHGLLAAAEDSRLDPDATRAELEAHKDLLEQMNSG